MKNFLHQINVTLAKGMGQSQGIQLIDAHIAVEMVKLDLIKGFLLYNKLVLNVQEAGKKLQIHAVIVVEMAINKQLRKFL